MQEGLLPVDVIHSAICPHLDVYDLCRLQQVNKAHFFTFIAEPAFWWIRNRILREIPAYQMLFDKYPWKYGERRAELGESKAKKQKKAWVMPRGGTWYLIKTFFRHLWTIKGLKKLSKEASSFGQCHILHGLCFAFELDSGPVPIVLREYHGNGRRYHFDCFYVLRDGRLVGISLLHRNKGLSIGILDNVGSRSHLYHQRIRWEPYLTYIFQSDRIRRLIMGEQLYGYEGVLKRFCA